jgi:hypothetical protein
MAWGKVFDSVQDRASLPQRRPLAEAKNKEDLPSMLKGFRTKEIDNTVGNLTDLATSGAYKKGKWNNNVRTIQRHDEEGYGRGSGILPNYDSKQFNQLSTELTDATASGKIARHNAGVRSRQGTDFDRATGEHYAPSNTPVIKIDSSKPGGRA